MRNIIVFVALENEPQAISEKALKLSHQLHANLILAKTHADPALIEELHHEDYFLADDRHFSDLNELVDFIHLHDEYQDDFDPTVGYTEELEDEPATIKQFVVRNNVVAIIRNVSDHIQTDNDNSEKDILWLTRCINCPHLFIPGHCQLEHINKIAYFTDLRYCDIGVINFLKVFNAFIYIIHLSANGLPDMHQPYAQAIVSEEIAHTTGYNKLFLRNIRNGDRANQIDKILNETGAQLCVFVNKKNNLLEEFFSESYKRSEALHKLPLLVVPLFDWFISKI